MILLQLAGENEVQVYTAGNPPEKGQHDIDLWF